MEQRLLETFGSSPAAVWGVKKKLKNTPHKINRAMKTITLLLAMLLLYPFVGYTQISSDFGAVSKEEIDMKECAFDKDAAAVILIKEAVADHDEEYHLITMHHVRIKILKEKAFDEANVVLHF